MGGSFIAVETILKGGLSVDLHSPSDAVRDSFKVCFFSSQLNRFWIVARREVVKKEPQLLFSDAWTGQHLRLRPEWLIQLSRSNGAMRGGPFDSFSLLENVSKGLKVSTGDF